MKKMLEVLKPILTAAVLAFAAYGFLHYVSRNMGFRVPDLMKLQELAVKKLSGSSVARQSWCQVGDGYAYDYFNLINFDRTAGTITVSRMDAVHSHIRHVADYMIFICFVAAGGILGGFFLFRRTGMTQSVVSEYERGKRAMTEKAAVRFAAALGIAPACLLA